MPGDGLMLLRAQYKIDKISTFCAISRLRPSWCIVWCEECDREVNSILDLSGIITLSLRDKIRGLNLKVWEGGKSH